MNKHDARARVLGYLRASCLAGQTCDDEKDECNDKDRDRLCDAEQYWAAVFDRLIKAEAGQ